VYMTILNEYHTGRQPSTIIYHTISSPVQKTEPVMHVHVSTNRNDSEPCTLSLQGLSTEQVSANDATHEMSKRAISLSLWLGNNVSVGSVGLPVCSV
jgi:hypothetical protein